MRPEGRVLGLDLGSRRIGVAVSDAGQRVASPLTTLTRRGDLAADHRQVGKMVAEYEAVGVVVGLPLTMSGDVGAAAAAVKDEAEAMRSTLGIDIEMVDERLTSVSAASALRSGGRRARDQRPVIDQTAAAILLQTWLDRAGTRAESRR
jgi:putative Holliday junction resolvase